MNVISKQQSSANASFERVKLLYAWLIFCVLASSHYNRLLKSREKFKQWHLQFFKLSRDETLISRDETLVSRDEILVSREGGNLLLSGTV